MQQTEKIRIREARLEDVDDILAVSNVLGYSSIPYEAMKKSFLVMLSSSDHTIWVAEDLQVQKTLTNHQNKVIGWIHAFHALRLASSNFIEIGGIAVSSEQQGKGAGRALVRTAYEWAESLNCYIRVRCNENRLEAHQFYQALGFTHDKNQKIFQLKRGS